MLHAITVIVRGNGWNTLRLVFADVAYFFVDLKHANIDIGSGDLSNRGHITSRAQIMHLIGIFKRASYLLIRHAHGIIEP